MRILLGLFLGFMAAAFVMGCEWKSTNQEDAKILAEEKKEISLLNYLVEPTSAILYSLEPSEKATGDTGFHGWKILGQVRLDPDDAPKAAQEFKDAVDAYKENMPVGSTFTPRVGIRVTKAGKSADFALCYECSHMTAYGPDGKTIQYDAAGSPLTLNEMLLAFKLPISQPAK